MTNPASSPIAIVGVSAIFPGSVSRDGFWRDILAGRDLIQDVPPTHWRIDDYFDPDPTARDKVYAKRGAFLSGVTFDAMGWGVPPAIVPATDTTQLLALIVAQRVLDDATRGGGLDDERRARTSVILGVTSAQELLGNMVSRLQRPIWAKALRETGLGAEAVEEACERIANHYVEWQESTFPGVLGNVIAGRIANRLDLGGTNCVTDAACASSFSALSMAVQELRLGDSDLVIAGGADTMNDIFMYMCFSKTPALSPTGDCRPFSEAADGTLLGEGLGMFALRRLDDAERDGDPVYAVLRGVGASSDGRAKSVYAPVAAGQSQALRRAYAQAGYSPGTVGLVEAHGTGTKAGDMAEFEGLSTIFAPARTEAPSERWCALGSIKSQIGHTKAAAGAAGLFKAVMALHHRVLPPTLKVDAPHPGLDIETSPFYLNTEARPWIRRQTPRRAGVSAFGFGGSNFHVTVEQYEGPAGRPGRIRSRPCELLTLSAASPEALREAMRAMREEATATTAEGVEGWAFWVRESQRGFDPHASCRLAVLVEGDAHLAAQLADADEMIAAGASFRSPTGIHFGRDARDAEAGVAALFPGQGSQYVGMGAGLAMDDDDAIAVWDRAEGVTPGLADVVFPRPAFSSVERGTQRAQLRRTEWAQPALAATSMAQWRMLRRLGLRVAGAAGHSFGEVMALWAAGVWGDDDALAIARRRGSLMAEASAATDGAMCSVRATRDDVIPHLPHDVVVANHNAPRQVVISGPTASVLATAARLSEAGFRTTRGRGPPRRRRRGRERRSPRRCAW
ncbi:MAG: beta-ketoacyl synthase N-terminal-like domain-containing protein, partial [Myxococcota bacterium]